MSDTVIQVENLSKKYIIGHQQQERYTALRDVMANGAKSLGQRLLKPWGKQSANPAYEEFWALKDVSFEVKQGDRIGIIGRNGAGKSTLLKILSRITEPTTGRIRIKGRVASLLEVGTGFHAELTGRENIYLNGAILGMSKAEIKHKFDEIVAFAEVEKFLDTPVKRYSSGMYVRLAFAVAAHLEPEILVVDEVLAVGDIQFQKKCLGKMRDVSGEGRTILFVSHNIAAIKSLCSKGFLMDSGRIEAQGYSSQVIENYLSKDSYNSYFYKKTDLEKKKPIFIETAQLMVSELGYQSIKIVSLKINYSVTVDRIGAVIALQILNSLGEVISTLIDTDSDLSIFMKQKGKYTVTCRIPNDLLCPGQYFINISIADMKITRYDFLERVLSFEIHSNPKTENIFNGREGNLLFVEKWHLQKLE